MNAAAVDLTGRVALVTGASRGIGRGIATVLAAAGASVAVNYRERADEAAKVVAAIEAGGGRAVAVAGDVSVQAAVTAVVAETTEKLGPIDILVNNAGIGSIRDIGDLDEAEFDRVMTVNVKSTFLCTQAVLPGMRARRWGRVVNVSSVAARGAGAVGVHYNASKAAIEGMTRSYAARLAKEGITVNAVAPGLIDTELAQPLKEMGVGERIPVGRLGTAEEIGQATLMIVGNGFMTGQCIGVNGGVLFA